MDKVNPNEQPIYDPFGTRVNTDGSVFDAPVYDPSYTPTAFDTRAVNQGQSIKAMQDAYYEGGGAPGSYSGPTFAVAGAGSQYINQQIQGLPPTTPRYDINNDVSKDWDSSGNFIGTHQGPPGKGIPQGLSPGELNQYYNNNFFPGETPGQPFDPNNRQSLDADKPLGKILHNADGTFHNYGTSTEQAGGISIPFRSIINSVEDADLLAQELGVDSMPLRELLDSVETQEEFSALFYYIHEKKFGNGGEDNG